MIWRVFFRSSCSFQNSHVYIWRHIKEEKLEGGGQQRPRADQTQHWRHLLDSEGNSSLQPTAQSLTTTAKCTVYTGPVLTKH